jgi:hypothetical protein
VGVDPDFVQLYGARLNTGGLTVPVTNATVQIQASESTDPGDNRGHVTLTVKATAPGAPQSTASGSGTGMVLLNLGLPEPASGRTYTISWSATFDNGMHACPATYTLANTPGNPNPFKVTTR